MEQDSIDHLCPICGQSNACQQVEQPEKLKKGCGTDACWCLTVKLNDQTRQKLSAQTDGKRCLCQSCIDEISQNQQ
tara:strand:+ start:174 stop:401 length:228 start_codon:yes stop_codon:yes gene_type:complete